MSEIAVSVIVPARDAAATIGRTLEALGRQDCPGGFEILVIDDGSRDATVAIAEAAGARVLRQPGLGPGQARNLGAERAAGQILAFTDADCFPEPGWLAAGVRALVGADLVQGRVIPDPEAPRGPFDHTIWVVRESGLYETANLFVRRDLYLRVGGFEDWLEVEIGKRLGEDVWFGWKARRVGARTGFAPDALVHHAVFPRTRREFIEERRRLVYFPTLVRRMPELRRHFLRAGIFVTPRSAAAAAAAAGLALGGLTLAVGGGARAAIPLSAVGPYLVQLTRRAAATTPQVAGVELLADAVGLSALLRGSLRSRTLVL